MRSLILLLAGLSALSAAELYRVAGVIVDSQTGQPIANASIVLSPGEQSRSEMVTTSGSDGRFAFDVARGKFRLSGVVAGASLPFGQMNPVSGMGCAIITGPDQDTTHLVFRWFRPAAIAGRVLDDQGEPVEGARVQLFYSGVVAGHARVTPASQYWSDDRGDYRVWGIPSGTYYLAVIAEPWYRNVTRAAMSEADSQAAYAITYYPGTTDVTRAAPLRVQPGEEAHADFSLTATAGAKVTVNCDSGDADAPATSRTPGEMSLSLIAEGVGGTDTSAAQQTVYRCPFTVNGVLPGHYLVRLSDTGAANPRTAQRWIDIGAGDMTLSLSWHPPASVTGKVTFKNGAPRPSGSLVVRLLRELDVRSASATIGPDGGFRIPRVQPGKYRVFVYGGDFYAETVRASDVTVPDGVVNIEDGVESRLSIVASNESGHLKGFATRDDQPVANMLVVLVPRSPVAGSPNRAFQTDSDGSFDWPALPTGDYLLFAGDDPTIAFADAETVKPYLSQAKSIRIQPGKVYEERIPVLVVSK